MPIKLYIWAFAQRYLSHLHYSLARLARHCFAFSFTAIICTLLNNILPRNKNILTAITPKEELCVGRSGKGSCGGFYVDSVQCTVKSLYCQLSNYYAQRKVEGAHFTVSIKRLEFTHPVNIVQFTV